MYTRPDHDLGLPQVRSGGVVLYIGLFTSLNPTGQFWLGSIVLRLAIPRAHPSVKLSEGFKLTYSSCLYRVTVLCILWSGPCTINYANILQ